VARGVARASFGENTNQSSPDRVACSNLRKKFPLSENINIEFFAFVITKIA